MSGEPSIQARDETGGGERFAGDYRMEEDSRSLYSRRYADERVVEREGPRCLTLCPGLHAGPRRFGFAGIDARGYLVWPGKVEY